MSTVNNGCNQLSVTDHIANYSLLGEPDNASVHTNNGATGAVVITLPPASAANIGLRYTFSVATAQALRADPNGTDTISLPSTGVPGAAGKYLGSSTIGATVDLACLKVGNWSVLGYTAAWVAEA